VNEFPILVGIEHFVGLCSDISDRQLKLTDSGDPDARRPRSILSVSLFVGLSARLSVCLSV